ncbi:MAG: cytochrome c oxidase subunit 3 [Alphaproteobacteria bacterium]|nr:cytochrome c oxidase subunit 3 [Alphaproteobacteria bacterium]
MIVSLTFMAIVALVIGRWLYSQKLTSKPWATEGIEEDERGHIDLPTPKLGLVIFLFVATSLFGLSVSAYYMRMGFADWTRLADPQILWLNTGLLIAGSVAFEWGRASARRGRIDQAKFGVLTGGGFAIAFLIGQYLAWIELRDLGYFAETNPANAFFYFLTAVHGMHVVGGLVAWVRTSHRLWRDDRTDKVAASVDMCAVYWHFLLLIWLGLFGLLLAT